MDIERLRSQVASGEKPLRITTHAQVEAAKDGLLLADLRIVTVYVPDPDIWIANVRRRRRR